MFVLTTFKPEICSSRFPNRTRRYEIWSQISLRIPSQQAEIGLSGGMETQIIRNRFGIEEDTVYYQGRTSHFPLEGKINPRFLNRRAPDTQIQTIVLDFCVFFRSSWFIWAWNSPGKSHRRWLISSFDHERTITTLVWCPDVSFWSNWGYYSQLDNSSELKRAAFGECVC